MSAHQYDEGHTVAGWTGVAVATVGTSVLGLGVCTVSGALIAVGLVITAASALVTWALHLSGWGKPPGRRPREQWGMRVRDTGARQGHPGCVGCRMAGRRGARTGGRGGARAAATPPEPVSVASRSAEPVSGAAVSTESVG
ncbi:HGxxPAAW family protein [Streptomyces sp. WSLK1-5]|uniref:HGxxPAAW family protein n=1 Tax=unclassified Streptomyces TaxID=2593676 RepID=UPI0037A52D52